MCKTNYAVKIFYDGEKTAKELLTETIVAKVRKKLDSDIEISKGKEYNTDNTQGTICPSLSGLCG